MNHSQLHDDHHAATLTVGTAVDEDPSVLIIRPWFDPGLALEGFELRSTYVERYWLGVLGPSAIMLLRRLARGLDERPDGYQISVADTARAIGLGRGTGRQSPITRTIDRACLFSTMRRASDTELHVRTHLPRLTPRQLSRLPLAVRNSHGPWLAAHRAGGPGAPHAA